MDNGLDAFLKHNLSGGTSEYINGDWKDAGEIVLWLHPGNDLRTAQVYNHSWYTVAEYEDRDTGDKDLKVRWQNFGCCDPEKVAKQARWYNDDGTRQHPPRICPMDFMLEWVSIEISEGRLDWLQPVFEFKGDDPEKNRLLRAGGLLGLYNRQDLSKEDQAKIKKAGIVRAKAFMQNVSVKGGYVIGVVDDDARDGAKKFNMQGSLADRFKEALLLAKRGDTIDNPETGRKLQIFGGDPMLYPYKFTYNAKAEPSRQYGCAPLNRKPDAQILEIFNDEPCPDMTVDKAKGNCLKLRLDMEEHALIKMPFDSFFEEADKAGLMKSRDEKPKKTATRTPEIGSGTAMKKTATAAPASTTTDAKDELECVSCGQGMGSEDLVCGKCGATYDDESGDLDGLPCLNCGTVVPIESTSSSRSTRHICPKCATIHQLEFVDDKSRSSGERPDWSRVEAVPPEDPGDDLPY